MICAATGIAVFIFCVLCAAGAALWLLVLAPEPERDPWKDEYDEL